MELLVMESSHSMIMSLVRLIYSNNLLIWYLDLATHEHMLEYYHGMCKELCVRGNWQDYTDKKLYNYVSFI